MHTVQFLRIALRSIRHSGQRALVALLCIAFGVLSLTAMTHLAGAIESVLLTDPQKVMGGDLTLHTSDFSEVGPAYEAKLAALKADGSLADYTLVSNNYTLAFRLADSGQLNFINNGIGVDPHKYPLLGSIWIAAEQGAVPADLPALLQQTGDILVTQDLAQSYHLQVGDELFLSDLENGVPLKAFVRAIVTDTPSHLGGQIFYNLETARLLAGSAGVVIDTALALITPAQAASAPDPAAIDALTARLEDQGWDVYTALAAAEGNKTSRDFFDITLKGAGILGLLVGCIGIANTMQVLLARRMQEVAVLKTLGYTQNSIMILFLIEAFALGAAGTLLGLILGELVYAGLLNLFTNSVNMLLSWAPAPAILLNGLWIGVLTTLLFAWIAIVRASAVRPAAILRSEALETNALSRLKLLGMVLLLLLPFTLTTSLIMGSAVKGVGIVLFALAGLVVLGGLMAGTIWLFTRLLPRRFTQIPVWGGLLSMARSSLQQRGLTLVFAMIALFTGVVTLTLAGVVTIGAQGAMTERSVKLAGDNLMVIAAPLAEAEVRQALQSYAPEHLTEGYELPIQKVILPDGVQISEYARIYPVLIGRSQLSDYQVQGAPWGSAAQGVYAAEYLGLPAGARVTIELLDGSQHELEIVGSYQLNYDVNPYRTNSGLLMSSDLLQSLGEPQSLLLFARFPASQLASTAEKLGIALPQSIVLNTLAFFERYVATYHNLFIFALAMASLSLLAGILLIANAVSLALIHRRYELGVLKAVGYARRHILGVLALEYTFVALAAGILAVIAVQIFLVVMGLINSQAANLLQLNWPIALGGILAGVLLTLLTVLIVTWRPSQDSPVVVLNQR